MNEEFAGGASAARNKLATYLRRRGIDVEPSHYGCPPTDDDFLKGILAAFREGSTRLDSGAAMVIFQWWNSTYQLVVPSSVLDYLSKNPERRHDLFTATSPGGENTFYLAVDREGNVVVHKKKHWRKDLATIDTTILQIR